MVLFIVVACLAQEKKYDSREGVKEKKRSAKKKHKELMASFFRRQITPQVFVASSSSST